MRGDVGAGGRGGGGELDAETRGRGDAEINSLSFRPRLCRVPESSPLSVIPDAALP